MSTVDSAATSPVARANRVTVMLWGQQAQWLAGEEEGKKIMAGLSSLYIAGTST